MPLASDVLTGLLVLAHTALTLIDVVGVVNLADFLVRCDGSQQDPASFLPIERILVTLVAFPFLTVLLAFVLAPRKNAALISAATHACYILHQVVHYDTWQALFHPNTDLTMEFFIYSKAVWVVVSLIIWGMESTQQEEMALEKKK